MTPWTKPEQLLRLRGWRRNGADLPEIAGKIGVSLRTLKSWMRKVPTIDDALKTDRECADFLVEEALFDSARKGNAPSIKLWFELRGQQHGQSGSDEGIAGWSLERKLAAIQQLIQDYAAQS